MKTKIEEGEPQLSAPGNAPRSRRVTSELSASTAHEVRVEIKTILVPLDFSGASMEALAYAVSLAKKFHAAVHLVHVHHPDEASSVAGAGHLMRETAKSIAFLREHLSEVQRKHVPSFWPENCHVRGGVAYQEIVDLAREINADLIILATRGHTGLKRILLGSTAERVVRFANCPVLVVRQQKRRLHKAGTETELRIHKILVPTDFSQCSLAGLIHAAYFARPFDARLRLFHVLYQPGDVVLDRVSANLGRAAGDLQRKDAELEMAALLRLDFLRDAKCETEIRTGDAVEEICGETSLADIDLVVTSTHGHGGFKHMLLGSVAEHVVRYAKCPVMVVPSRFGTAR